MSCSLSWSLLRVAGSQLSWAVAAMAHTFLMSASASMFSVDTFFLAQSLGKSISIVVRPALMVLRSEVV